MTNYNSHAFTQTERVDFSEPVRSHTDRIGKFASYMIGLSGFNAALTAGIGVADFAKYDSSLPSFTLLTASGMFLTATAYFYTIAQLRTELE